MDKREEFAKQFIEAGVKNGYPRDEVIAKLDLALSDYDKQTAPQQPTQQPEKKEGFGTFAKSALEATGLPTFGKNLQAGYYTAKSMELMNRDPKKAQEMAEKALQLRQQTGMEKTGLGTLVKGLGNTAQVGATVYGLATNPVGSAQTALAGVLPGAAISKLTGGTFSEGAGAAVGAAPSLATAGEAIKAIGNTKYVKNISSQKGIIDKLQKTIAPFSQTGSEKQAAAAARQLPVDFSRALSESVDKAVATSDPRVMSGLKRILSTGKTSAEAKEIAQMSAEQLKKYVSSYDPTSMVDALAKRQALGKMAQWAKLKEMLNRGSGNANAAKILYQSLNQQIHQSPSLAQADKIIARTIMIDKGLKWLLGGFLVNKALDKVLGQNNPVNRVIQIASGNSMN